MRFSLTLGRPFGTAVRLHVTFVLFLGVVGAVAYAQGGPALALTTVGFITAIFTCVVLHEFGHILAARRYGIETADVVLLPIGGVARMARMPETPGHEIVVALAGPAVNVAIAAILVMTLGGLPTFAETLQPTPSGFAGRLLYANLLLVVFNLIPAFPMDGGRVLRALLAMWRGPVRGTRIAAGLGQGLAVVFGLIGLFAGNLILLLVGAFIFFAAAAERRAVNARAAVAGLRNAEAMIVRFARVPQSAGIGDALACRLATGQALLAVCDGAGRLAGLVDRRGLLTGLGRHGAGWPVVDVMAQDVAVVGVDGDMAETARLIQEGQRAAVGVVDAAGRLVGLVTRDTLDDVLAIADGRALLARGGLHAALGRGTA